MTCSPLLRSLFDEPDETLLSAVRRHLENGQDPDAGTEYGETPLKQAYRRGRMDVFALLLELGADLSAMRWGPVHRAVALGDMEALQDAANDGDLSARDVEGLTPFLLACALGEVEKAEFLLPATDDANLYTTHHRGPALALAAERGQGEIVRWLLANGFDVNETDAHGGTALIAAAEADRAGIVEILLQGGADTGAKFDLSAAVRNIDRKELDLPPLPEAMKDKEFFETAASETTSARVARLLIRAGVPPQDFDNDVLRELTGAALIPAQDITPAVFEAQKQPRFGTANPEQCTCEFWLEMIRTGHSGYAGHEIYGGQPHTFDGPAVWSFDRFGMSTMQLPDGKWVQIAGEHEDFYDPDFWIYNDVVVHDGAGNTQVYIYPREIFPPTDFHTATFVDDAIVLIGSLGYEEERRPGETQVLRLNMKDLSIERIETTGESPGWISRHRARLDGDRIVVWDGMVWDGADYVAMEGTYALSRSTGAWRKVAEE